MGLTDLKRRYSAIVLLSASLPILAFSPVVSGSQMPDTLSLNFHREVTQNGSIEVTKGVAYYKAPQKVFIEVNEPISQIMVIDGEIMTIYYPVDKKAFRIRARGPIPLPFIQTILSVMKDDYGLTEMGYTLAKHEVKDGTLYTYWNPPRKLKKRLGKFILGTADGLLVYAEARNSKGKIAAKSLYKNHTEVDGRCFPLEVCSEIYQGRRRTEEHVIYSDVKFNISLPERVVSFEIPKFVPVKEIEW